MMALESSLAAPIKRWVPSLYVDEDSPEPRSSPNDWVASPGGADYFLEPLTQVLRDGTTVAFDWMVDIGRVTVTISGDGSWTSDVAVPEPPAGSTLQVMEYGDSDMRAGSLDEFVSNYVDYHGHDALAGGVEVDVDCFAWCRGPVIMHFFEGKFLDADFTVARAHLAVLDDFNSELSAISAAYATKLWLAGEIAPEAAIGLLVNTMIQHAAATMCLVCKEILHREPDPERWRVATGVAMAQAMAIMADNPRPAEAS